MTIHKIQYQPKCRMVIEWLLCVMVFANGAFTQAATDQSPNNPFYVDHTFPKLTTPQWIGEEGVDAVVILAIDDLRTPDKFESYLRPILDRLKRIDGRAPVSIYCNALEPDHQQFQSWLDEGLSLEVHTLSHPCPLLAKGDFSGAVNTVMGGIDLLNTIPNNHAVAYRMPCCDSINSPSPRFYSEIFPMTSAQGNYLKIDSSIMCLFTSQDKSLPRDLILDENQKERFTKYVPFPSFTTTIENYPYPYVINNVCWEFPALAPSDWEAQNLHGVNNEITVEDWKRALDLTVIKKGVFTWIFHPHGWIRNDQVNAFIDYATETYGKRVKFLTFKEASDRLTENLLMGQGLRQMDGSESGVRLLDSNHDGYLDVLLGAEDESILRVWQPGEDSYSDADFPVSVLGTSGEQTGLIHGVFWADGPTAFLFRNGEGEGAWVQRQGGFEERGSLISELRCDGKPVPTVFGGNGNGLIVHDVDGDGVDELIIAYPNQQGVLKWNQERQTWETLNYQWPDGVQLVDAHGRDAGVRLVDINDDGHVDLIRSDEKSYVAYLFIPEWVLGFQKGWTRLIMEGDRIDEDAIPAFVRDGPHRDNGAWFSKGHVWVQNEDTAHLPDLVQRKSFREILLGNRPQPKDVDDALAAFELDDAFEIQCVASEPLVEDPVAFEWSADGCLWVAEMRDYPLGLDAQGKPGGRIKRLKDIDSDGIYDEAEIFLDDIPFPSGLYPWENGLWISAAPYVFFAADLDGDGKADMRRNLLSGFGEGNQQHRVNGFNYGLDHWLYGANGDSGGEIESLWTEQTWDLRRKDFRFNPVTGEFQTLEGQTQFGRNRDDWGNWFGNNNPNWLWHYHFPERYTSQSTSTDYGSNKIQLAADVESKRVNQIAPSLQRFNEVGLRGHVTSACSATPYRDTLLFDDDHQHMFVSEPVHNLVRHFELSRDGVRFKAERPENEQSREFLASNDPWFRPTMLKTGPDGGLYMADMYRLVIEHTEWIPDDVEQYMDPRAGTDKGRIYAVTKKGQMPQAVPRLASLSASDLVVNLGHENGWQRDTAQRLLIESNASEQAPALKKLLRQTENPVARLHGLWVLRLLGQLSEDDLLFGISDLHPEVRRNALILGESHQSPVMLGARYFMQPLEAALEGLKDPSAAVRFQAILSTGSRLENWKVKAFLEAMHENATDPIMRQALLTAIPEYLRPMLTHVVSCSQCKQTGLLKPLIKSGLSKHPDWVALKLDQNIQSNVDVAFWNSEISSLDWEDKMPSELAKNLNHLPWTNLALGEHMDALSIAFHYLKYGGALKLNTQISIALRRFATSVLLGVRNFNSSERFIAFQYVWTSRSITHWTPWLEYLFSAKSELSQKIREEMWKVIIADIEPLGAVTSWHGSIWTRSSLGERRLILALLLKKPEWSQKFLQTLKTGLFQESQQVFDDTSLTQEMELSLRRLNDPALRSLAIQALDKRRERLGWSNKKSNSIKDRFNAMAQLVRNPSNGQQIFQQNCGLCHRFQGAGVQVGPDLDALKDRSGLSLLTAILNPNETIEQAYYAYELILKDESEQWVLIQNETSKDLTITTTTGEPHTYSKDQIESFNVTTRSLMPEGWGEAMRDQDLADLIGYLQSSAD